MGNYPQITAPAALDESDDLDYTTDADYPVTVRIAYPSVEEGLPESAECKHCYDVITREDESSPWTSRVHGAECLDNLTDDEDEDGVPIAGPHEVDEVSALHPSQWLNSARIVVSEEEVTCVVSVNDPRGGFAFTVRRAADGSFYIHTPYPGETMPHMRTEQVHPGTLRTVRD